jgi:gentisate 1,2-dioxygenase
VDGKKNQLILDERRATYYNEKKKKHYTLGNGNKMSYEKGDDLESFNDELAALNMRGQWLSDDRRDHGTGGAWKGDVWESTPRGDAHIWSWKDTEPLLEKSCDAIPESFTARRSLVFSNPGLERSTTHTMNVGIQLIKPGELAWAHRHTISALRFVIEGHKDLYTVVDGAVCPMADNDLILTPNWQWHDHHNQSDGRALWLDVLDGPLIGALNQTLFENFGQDQQAIRNELLPARLHYPWAEIEASLNALGESDISPNDGYMITYRDPETGGPVVKTMEPAIQKLPAGFKGAPHRHSSSTIYFVIRGSGQSDVDGKTIKWGARDCFTIPAWAGHTHQNGSGDEDALLFAATDGAALRALGLYREEQI